MVESSYTPSFCKDLEFYFYFTPAEPTTFHDPGCPAEVEFTKVEYKGEQIDGFLEEHLFEHIGDRVEMEILNYDPKREVA